MPRIAFRACVLGQVLGVCVDKLTDSNYASIAWDDNAATLGVGTRSGRSKRVLIKSNSESMGVAFLIWSHRTSIGLELGQM